MELDASMNLKYLVVSTNVAASHQRRAVGQASFAASSMDNPYSRFLH